MHHHACGTVVRVPNLPRLAVGIQEWNLCINPNLGIEVSFGILANERPLGIAVIHVGVACLDTGTGRDAGVKQLGDVAAGRERDADTSARLGGHAAAFLLKGLNQARAVVGIVLGTDLEVGNGRCGDLARDLVLGLERQIPNAIRNGAKGDRSAFASAKGSGNGRFAAQGDVEGPVNDVDAVVAVNVGDATGQRIGTVTGLKALKREELLPAAEHLARGARAFELDCHTFGAGKFGKVKGAILGNDVGLEGIGEVDGIGRDGRDVAGRTNGSGLVRKRNALVVDREDVALSDACGVVLDGNDGVVIVDRNLGAVGNDLDAALENNLRTCGFILIRGVPDDLGVGQHGRGFRLRDVGRRIDLAGREREPPAVDGNLKIIAVLLDSVRVVCVGIRRTLVKLEAKTVVECFGRELARNGIIGVERLTGLDVHDAEVRRAHDGDVTRGGRVDVREIVVRVLFLVDGHLKGVDELGNPIRARNGALIRERLAPRKKAQRQHRRNHRQNTQNKPKTLTTHGISPHMSPTA